MYRFDESVSVVVFKIQTMIKLFYKFFVYKRTKNFGVSVPFLCFCIANSGLLNTYLSLLSILPVVVVSVHIVFAHIQAQEEIKCLL